MKSSSPTPSGKGAKREFFWLSSIFLYSYLQIFINSITFDDAFSRERFQ